MTAQLLDHLGGHRGRDAHRAPAAEVPISLPGQKCRDAQRPSAGQGPSNPTGQAQVDARESYAGGAQSPAAGVMPMAAPMARAPRLLDPFLALSADVVGDLEAVRVANENRLRQLTRTGADKDGEERGFGLDATHPDVARLTAIVELIGRAEHDAVLQLQRAMRRHALGPWVRSTVGIGEKQAARLLAAIGDPYWNTLHDRPRTVSELWAFCGFHTLPCGQGRSDAQTSTAAGGQTGSSDPGQRALDTHRTSARVAARRQRGQKDNWSAAAKMRAYLVAESCIKQARSPYRPVYDARRAATSERVHAVACVRCGPSGKPAQPGTAWSAGHQHADALRIVAKRILRDLWRAARDLHVPADPSAAGAH